MRVGIIGSGKVGQALGSWIAATGDSVTFASRDPKHAQEAATEAGHGAKAATLADLVADCTKVRLDDRQRPRPGSCRQICASINIWKLVYVARRGRLKGLLAAGLSERHKRPAGMLVCPCLFAPGVQSYDYFAVRGSGNNGAAIVWTDEIRDIVAVVANAAEYRHGPASVAGKRNMVFPEGKN
jgi:NADP oxidoreductase coenzyme F420-dependent